MARRSSFAVTAIEPLVVPVFSVTAPPSVDNGALTRSAPPPLAVRLTVSGPPGTPVPVTAPAGTRSGGAAFGQSYGGQQSAYVKLGSKPLKLTLPAAPFRIPAA